MDSTPADTPGSETSATPESSTNQATVETQASIEAPTEIDNSEKSTPEISLKEIAKQMGLPYLESLESAKPPRDLSFGEFSRLLGSWGKTAKAVPIYEEEGVVTVAVANPLNTEAVDIIRFCYDKPVEVVVAPEKEIVSTINLVRSSLMSDRDSSLEDDEENDISTSLKIDVTDAEDDEAPIIRYVNTLIFRAAEKRASDVHIEPFEDTLKVRFRVDGVLHDIDEESKSFQASILSRIKVMANLNIAEKRLPQDGRIGLKIAGQDVDIRVSTVPTRYGERIVMRLLDKSNVTLSFDSLGLSPNNEKIIKKMIQKSHGICLVTGPTGSGKTTTLYTCLSEMNSEDRNILTVEDPVEYEVKGVGQMQVNPKIDFTFASGLRAILRQDPDVIMLGEIRDLETVEIAIQASMTGHLVFSTLHTNDAPGAVTRLMDMGVEPFLISSSLLMIMAQRLVRALCSDCKVPHQLTPEECKEIGLPENAIGASVFKASEEGCPECQKNSYRGRAGIHELLLIDDKVRSLIMNKANASAIRQAATEMNSLRGDGALKVLNGVTSVEEVLRVTQEEGEELD